MPLPTSPVWKSHAFFRFLTLSGVIWVAVEYFWACWLPPKASQTWVFDAIIMSCAVAPKGDRYSAAAHAASAAARAIFSLVFIFDLIRLDAAVRGVADHIH